MALLRVLLVLAVLLIPGCGFNRAEYEKMIALRDEYIGQLSEVRQNNEIINRNIISAYQELDVLKTRLNERTEQARAQARAQTGD